MDEAAVEEAQHLALAGAGPVAALATLREFGPEWVWDHAGRLLAANPTGVRALVDAAAGAPVSRRERIVRDLARVAPERVRGAIVERVAEPVRGVLLAAAQA